MSGRPEREVKGLKLAEALRERADLNIKIEELRARIVENAIVQEGEKPALEPEELLAELDGAIARLEELMARINLTNSSIKKDGRTITELIAHKDAVKSQISVYHDLISAASQTARRATRTEIRVLSAVDVKALKKKTDALSKELRETDAKIQELNWTSELL